MEVAIGDDRYERATLSKIDDVLHRIKQHEENGLDWILDNESKVSQLREDVETLRELATELPSHLHDRFRELAVDVRSQYRWAIGSLG
jgi:hypothetical protein